MESLTAQVLSSMFDGPAGPSILTGFRIVFELAPFWLPIFLMVGAWMLWITYIQSEFITNQETVLLEFRIPQIVDKSPAAMEAVLAGLHSTSGESTFIDRLWHGKVRAWHSLEIVSLGGQIHFYAWTRKSVSQSVINNFYAYYPDIEISIVPDYATRFDFSLKTHDLWGADFVLAGGNPTPLKTYIDYGLDKDPKEVYKINPIATLLEFLSSIGPKEQIWIQFVIRAHKGGLPDHSSMFKTHDFKTEAREAIHHEFENPEMFDVNESETGERKTKKLSKGQMDKISAIERKVGKYAFDGGLRGLYIGEKGSFNGSTISALVGMFKIFSATGFNGIKPTRWLAEFDYPWEDFREHKQNHERHEVFDAYRRRAWFYSPHILSFSVWNTEEIATIFHFPGEVVKSPGMPRIPSQRREAPANLPI